MNEGLIPLNIVSGSEEYCIFLDPSLDKDTELFKQKLEEKLAKEDFDFRGYCFPEDIDFKGTKFEKDADFRDATFQGAYFGGATFQKDVYFSEATFQGEANFAGATFPY